MTCNEIIDEAIEAEKNPEKRVRRLYRVQVVLDEVVEGFTASDAIDFVLSEEGWKELCLESEDTAYHIRCLSDLPKDWNGSEYPWGGDGSANIKEILGVALVRKNKRKGKGKKPEPGPA